MTTVACGYTLHSSSGRNTPLITGSPTCMSDPACILRGKDNVTIQYPEQRKPYSRRFRGVHVLTERSGGSLKCVACYPCETACPAECITIEAAKVPDKSVEKVASRYEIDLSRRIFCGFCVDACPEEALIMSREYDLTTHYTTAMVRPRMASRR